MHGASFFNLNGSFYDSLINTIDAEEKVKNISHFSRPRLIITGQNGVHLVREISPWSSQVLGIGLAQNLKPILSDDKYWNINPNISAFGM